LAPLFICGKELFMHYPVFLDLRDRPVAVIGGGKVAASKIKGLLDAGAKVTVVAPSIDPSITGVEKIERGFFSGDLDGKWFVVAAATPEVNRQVADAAESRCLFVNAVDDKGSASAFLGGVVRKGPVTLAISTDGSAPALAGLLREALEAVLPEDVALWTPLANELRAEHKRDRIPLSDRRPLLLQALNKLYGSET
jgi:uroporphyrin-III C-methyltransferase/precorrin-2 dehydrogenase/sirohydrochlorin ferrochelatase